MRTLSWVAAAAAAAALTLTVSAAQQVAGTVATPPVLGENNFYMGNRPPLLPNPLIKLPPGSIRPEGWLRHQLELMARGFPGRISEISNYCKLDGNAWISKDGRGQNGWEEVPYWLRGYAELGFVLQDEKIMAQANRWLEGVLSSTRPDGYFGPQLNLEGGWNFPKLRVPDLWPNMIMMYPIRSLYEVTGDQRILEVLKGYFRWQSRMPLDQLLQRSWQRTRAGDNLESIYWLYNQTGESWLLDVARVNHERTSDWTGGIPSFHVVDIAQGFREPAEYYQQAHDERYLNSTNRVYDTVRGVYGQVPGGLYGADEGARPGFSGPRQGTETCAMAEILFSHERLVSITGNPVWADRAEEVAFNSLPASMTPDLKSLHYLTAPNQIQLDTGDKSPMISNGGVMFAYNLDDYRCCVHNAAFAWPYYAGHLWMATRGNGLAAVLYAAGRVTARVGDGANVSIKEETNYPFEEGVNFTVSPDKPVDFPLYLRIPGWCAAPVLELNGRPVALEGSGRGWVVIRRTWRQGDRLHLRLPMQIRTTVWKQNRNTVSVERGPLTYSLKIGERWHRYGGTDEFPALEVFPTTPWNYGLVLDAGNPGASIQVLKSTPPNGQPFTPDAAPIVLRAKARRIVEWQQESNGIIGEVQPGPVRSQQPLEDVTLIPMGCARLRVSAFPQIGDGPEARTWSAAYPIVLASTSTWQEPPTVVNDGRAPTSSAAQDVPRFTWNNGRGRQWIEYRYSRPQRFRWAEVFWARDPNDTVGPCEDPAVWSVQSWDGKGWVPVKNSTAYEVRKDQFSKVSFAEVETSAIRLEVETRRGAAACAYEWRVGR